MCICSSLARTCGKVDPRSTSVYKEMSVLPLLLFLGGYKSQLCHKNTIPPYFDFGCSCSVQYSYSGCYRGRADFIRVSQPARSIHPRQPASIQLEHEFRVVKRKLVVCTWQERINKSSTVESFLALYFLMFKINGAGRARPSV